MRIGIDMGGTKIEAIALGEEGRVLGRRRIATPRGDYDATTRVMTDLVREFERREGSRGTVGIGIPGALSPATGRVKNANSVWLNGKPLREDLECRLDREVRIANDANCFALSEAIDGAGSGFSVVFGVIVGTGTGGGIAVDGRVLTGPNGICGEWGHNPLPWPEPDEWPGPACYCGKTGCIETFLSGPGLARDYRDRCGEELPSEEIVRSALRGDPGAEAALDRYELRMAKALAALLNILDPDIVVLGGGLSGIDRLYQKVPSLWQPFAFSDRIDTPLSPPRHGDSSGVRGAAWLWEP